MLNYQDYDVDFRELELNENEQKVVLDYLNQLGEILFNNNIDKLIENELEEKTKKESRKAS